MAVAVAPDGKRAVSRSYDNTLTAWRLVTGCELATLTGYTGSVNGVAVPDGNQAVSSSLIIRLRCGTRKRPPSWLRFRCDSAVQCCRLLVMARSLPATPPDGSTSSFSIWTRTSRRKYDAHFWLSTHAGTVAPNTTLPPKLTRQVVTTALRTNKSATPTGCPKPLAACLIG